MTGRYTVRLGTQSNVIYWDTPWGVPINETFLPQNMKAAGYHTAMFGKWHLGMFMTKYTPIARGFDEHMGYFQGCESAFTHIAACCTAGSPDSDQDFVCGNTDNSWGGKTNATGKDYRGYDWFRSGPAPANKGISSPDLSVNHTNSATLIQNAAVDFIGRMAKEKDPFFLYLPFQNIHGPYTCEHKYRQMYAGKGFTEGEMTMFGYMTEMDTAIGEIMTAFKASGKYENSYIFYSSDNGAPPASADVNHQVGSLPGWIARNYPLRGHKALIWEGGTRVPGFVHSPLLPEKVKGTTSWELYHVTDWLPTIVGLAGGDTAKNFALDGHNLWPSLSTGTASPRTEMVYNINPLCHGGQAGAPKAALRMGDFKLMSWCYEVAGIAGGNITRPIACPDEEDGCDPEFKKGPVLYNLTADIGETTNLAAKEPEQVKKMLARMAFLVSPEGGGMVEPQQWTPPFQGDDYFCKDCPLHPGTKGPGSPWLPWLDGHPGIDAK